MSNAVAQFGSNSGQNALEDWQVQHAQEKSLRHALTYEDPELVAPKRRRLCMGCIAGGGVIVAATVLLGTGILS